MFIKKYSGLERYINAQNKVYDIVLDELKEGKKESHWMWYIFPQIQGLGQSSVARAFEIEDQEEAEEYLEHLVLGSRLRECVELVCHQGDQHIFYIFPTDVAKFHACITLFSIVSEGG